MALGAIVKVLATLACLQGLDARPPVNPGGPGGRGAPSQAETNDTDWNLGLEYNRYLQEVVQVLESDPEFRKKLETADVEKIRDGSIANELEMVNHQIRSQLDVIKRRELERLRHLAMRQYEMQNGIDKRHLKIPGHIELQNPTFEIEDLRKLIKSTTRDLEEADKKRRTEFKRYEMEKKFEHEQRLSHIEDEEKRKEEEKRMSELEEKHKQHPKVNHPLTKDQLEEVWENQDHMRAQDWDPKTFFAMHDLNGDGFWDEDEVRVLFRKELDKVYDPNAPEDDMREREEEMERMREHVFKETDQDKNRLISYEEFLAETKREEYEKDPGWETIDQNHETPFSDEEFKAYEMQRMREIQGMINRGIVPDGYPYFGAVPPGAPMHPQLGVPGQAAYGQPHPGMQNQFGGQGQHMNVQPLRGEQNYNRQPLPQFAGAQPAHQFGQQQHYGNAPPQQYQGGQQFAQQQQFAPGQPQQQQQFAPGQPQQRQQFAPGQPQQPQQFAPGPPQQQQFAPGPPQQQQQFAPAQPQQQQQFAAPPQQFAQQQGGAAQEQYAEPRQPLKDSQAPPSPIQNQAAAPADGAQVQDSPPGQPKSRGQPVLRAQKSSEQQQPPKP